MADNSIIASDALKFMNIIETFFTTNSMEQIIVRPIFMEMNRWIVTASAPIVSPGTLKIVTADQNIEIPCDTESVSIEMFSNCYMLIFKKNLPDEMCLKLLFLKKTVRSCTRRSEERFEVGTSNFKKFGFSSPVQHFLYNDQKIQCFVNNASVHGAMITSRMSEIKTGERIKLLFSFENPPEKIVQFAIVVNRNCISGNYLRLSLYFLEPISFMWQKRICSL